MRGHSNPVPTKLKRPGTKRTKALLASAIVATLWPAFAPADELTPYPTHAQHPPLVLADLGGHSRSLDDYLGQVVLVHFWASWCPPCVAEIPSIQRLAKRLAGQPFSVVAVNHRESSATTWRFVKLFNMAFAVLLDKSGTAAADWGVRMFPTSFLVDRRGRVRYAVHGTLTWDDEPAVTAINGLLHRSSGAPDKGVAPPTDDGNRSSAPAAGPGDQLSR